MYCWGDNIIGELGHDPATDLDASTSTCLGSYPCAKSSMPVSGIASPAQIASGTFHSCALRSDGTLSCWGDNRFGAVGVVTPDSGPFCSGNKCEPTPHDVSGITSGARIAAGEEFECVLGTTATGLALNCLGSDESNALGRSAIPMGDFLPHPDPAPVDGVTTAIQVAVSFGTVCALLADHSVSCWGNDTQGEIGVDPANAPTTCDGDPCAVTPQPVADFACAIVKDGTVWCWGNNEMGQLGAVTNDVDGAVLQFTYKPVQVTGL